MRFEKLDCVITKLVGGLSLLFSMALIDGKMAPGAEQPLLVRFFNSDVAAAGESENRSVCMSSNCPSVKVMLATSLNQRT